ncbi:MAG: glycosyl hydrolase [Chlorobi bacterium]|nr:glycosyl hydrolase [Chlorobiota bacterium]
MKKIYFLLISAMIINLGVLAQIKIDKNTFGDVTVRSIGPASMSGRIAAVEAVNSDPRIVYVGTAGGGVWKSKNGGTTFEQVFKKNIQAIGAISIDQQHPDTVWVGTGEPWTRNSTSVGDGVYVTHDGGKTWENKGLRKTERFSYIAINPKNPNVVYAAALGPLWSDSPERGLFKTSDGGANWDKVLYIDEKTGCSSIAIDPDNPERLYAGFWDFRRKPWFFRSGGDGSSFFISDDGGKSWNKITEGLPKGIWGRVHVEINPLDNNIVYLLIEAKKTSFYRSKDKGKTWELMNNNSNMVGERPFYFGFFVPDPIDTNRVYKPGFALQVSDDGGKTFMSPSIKGGNFHSDVHGLWISPSDNGFMYMATDGGLFISRDAANSWEFCRNIPVSQFYHVSVDNAKPYNVFGGLQDNGSWIAPSKSAGGITNNDWKRVGWGDGFNVLRDPADDNIMYWQWQGGGTRRAYLDTRELKDIKPYSDDGTKLRFHWNTPLVIGSKSGNLYMGSQFLFTSSDKGNSWRKISPDLTTNDPQKLNQEETGGLTIDNSAAENHCTIFTIAESPFDENIVWVGTDDGNVQLTRNGGESWEKLNVNIQGVPPTTWVSYIEPSNHDIATAYITFDGHRYGDRNAYVYKTTDFGKTWQNIADENIDAYCHIIKEDLLNPNLLFLGTEYGLFISIDGGSGWTRFSGDMPKAAVRDMAFQARENDLVIATHGRGIFILDDLSPLQDLTLEKTQKNIAFLNSRPYKMGFNYGMGGSTGDDGFRGSNPSESLMINYYMKKRHIFGDMSLEIYNSNGEMIKTLPAGKRKGINRVKWRMRMEKPKVPSSVQLLGNAMVGPEYPPGDYFVKIIKNKDTIQGNLKVEYYDNPHHTIADRDKRHEVLMEAYNMLEDLAYLDNKIIEIRDQAMQKADSVPDPTSKKLKSLSKEMNDLRTRMLATKEGRITGEERLRERLGEIYGGVMGYNGMPTKSQIEGLKELKLQKKSFEQQVDDIIKNKLPSFDKKLRKAQITPFHITDKKSFMEKK